MRKRFKKTFQKVLAIVRDESSEVNHVLHWVGICIVFLIAVYVLGAYGPSLQANLFPLPRHAPFDGTAAPVVQVPDWANVTASERDLPYAQIPLEKRINLPAYYPVRLEIPFSNLSGRTREEQDLLNEKITYSVPYMGNYRLNGGEGEGSHSALDIKLPEGTPVNAMMNGIVTKVSHISSGFGVHVVLRHDNVPDADDVTRTATYYSSYSHLSSILVAEGDIVTKGQQIAYSGNTGTSTTPHLHFQMDTQDAPFHPYWPFTGAEARAAGMSFFEAINSGLGRESGLLYTRNPMVYIQQYRDAGVLVADIEPIEAAVEVVEIEKPMVDEPTTPVVVADIVELEPAHTVPAEPQNIVRNIHVTNGVCDVQNLTIEVGDTVQWLNTGPERERVFGIGSFGLSERISAGRSTRYVFELEGTYPYRCSEDIPGFNVITVVQIGSNPVFEDPEVPQGESLPANEEEETVQLFSDVTVDDPDLPAFEYLYDRGVAQGYSDGTFKPDRAVLRVEAVKMILTTIGYKIDDDKKALDLFSDLSTDAWYVDYVSAAYNEGFAKGYPGGTFGPVNEVNLVELLKMLFLAMQIDIDPSITIELPTGVSADAWYAAYLQEAIRENILDPGSEKRVNVGQRMTRRDVARIMFKVIAILETGAARYSDGLVF